MQFKCTLSTIMSSGKEETQCWMHRKQQQKPKHIPAPLHCSVNNTSVTCDIYFLQMNVLANIYNMHLQRSCLLFILKVKSLSVLNSCRGLVTLIMWHVRERSAITFQCDLTYEIHLTKQVNKNPLDLHKAGNIRPGGGLFWLVEYTIQSSRPILHLLPSGAFSTWSNPYI